MMLSVESLESLGSLCQMASKYGFWNVDQMPLVGLELKGNRHIDMIKLERYRFRNAGTRESGLRSIVKMYQR